MTALHTHPHEHEHAHPHEHADPNPAEAEPAAALGPSSILDIGGDVGAIHVVLAGPVDGGELEACPEGEPDRRFHTGVHRRTWGDRSAWIAVYPEVREGRYELLDADLRPLAVVDVDGGAVAMVDLR